MSIIEIPVRSDIPFYDMEITLERTAYFLEFYFNKRKDRWMMDILNQEKMPILVGTPLLTNVELLDKFAFEDTPPGLFLVLDLEGEQLNPGRNDLGDRVKLIYEEAA